MSGRRRKIAERLKRPLNVKQLQEVMSRDTRLGKYLRYENRRPQHVETDQAAKEAS